MVDFSEIEWVSFDCYGTLVDWETGIANAVSRALEPHSVRLTAPEILALFADAEPRVQSSGGFKEYRLALREVMGMIGNGAGVQFSQSEMDTLPESLVRWPVFPDVPDALTALKSRYRLAIISNVDDDLFEGSAQEMSIDFDAVITSQQARAYKPDLSAFHLAAEKMGVRKDRWLHVGESLFHDIGPANRLGIPSVWVKRPDRGGGTRPTDAVPDYTVGGLAELVPLVTPA